MARVKMGQMEGLITHVIGMTRQRLGISKAEQRWQVGVFSLGRPGSSLRLVHLAYMRVHLTVLLPVLWEYVDRNSSVGIATRYGLEGPGIESRWGRDFPHLSKPALGPTQSSVQ
jgi:hypothetical protein